MTLNRLNMVYQDEMVITLTGKESFDKPISIDGINKIVIDLRDHIGGNLHNAIQILQNIYGDTTLFKTDFSWYSLKNGKGIMEKTTNELAFKGMIVVLVSEKTASTAEIIALTFMCRPNAIVIGKPTAGFLTMNNCYNIDKKNILNLTISRMYDINENLYSDERIIPIV